MIILYLKQFVKFIFVHLIHNFLYILIRKNCKVYIFFFWFVIFHLQGEHSSPVHEPSGVAGGSEGAADKRDQFPYPTLPSFVDLNSGENLYGFNERIVATESLWVLQYPEQSYL